MTIYEMTVYRSYFQCLWHRAKHFGWRHQARYAEWLNRRHEDRLA